MTASPNHTPTANDEQSLLADEHAFRDQFRSDHPFVWAFTLFAPFVGTGLALAAAFVAEGGEFLRKLLAAAVATFFFFGRFVILGGTDVPGPHEENVASFLTRGELFAMVVWMDVAIAMLFVYHASFLYRMPVVGPRLLRLVEDGQFILAHQPWIRRATFVGLVAFVFFPLAATGAVGGSIFGRLLGMSRRATFCAILLGSVLGCTAMYLGAGVINSHLNRDNPWLTVGGIAVVAGIIVLLNWRYRKLKRRVMAARSNAPRA
ncbi:MAG: small multi-drug export protein [Phycisphaerales bacterium]